MGVYLCRAVMSFPIFIDFSTSVTLYVLVTHGRVRQPYVGPLVDFSGL